MAGVTVGLGMFPLSQISFYIGTALYSMCFVSAARPFESKLLNRVNFLNECLLLLTSYFLLILTDLVPDLEVRERIGWQYLHCLVAVVGLNFTIVFSQLVMLLLKKVKQAWIRKQKRKARAA